MIAFQFAHPQLWFPKLSNLLGATLVLLTQVRLLLSRAAAVANPSKQEVSTGNSPRTSNELEKAEEKHDIAKGYFFRIQ